MSKEKMYSGFAVVTKDILDDDAFKKGRFGIAFSDYNLEKCKSYCYGDRIIVHTYRVVHSRYIRVQWIKKYPRIEFPSKYSKLLRLGHLQIDWGTNHMDAYERIPVYQKENKS